MRQEVLQINEQAVMTEFSYGYCAALLKKLKDLKKEGKIFQDNNAADEAETQSKRSGGNYNSKLTPITTSVITALNKQVVGLKIDESSSIPSNVDEGIALVEEFLKIFEKNDGNRTK